MKNSGNSDIMNSIKINSVKGEFIMSEKLYLGIGRSIITPKAGAHLFGYSPNVISNSVNDDLTATVFYLKQGNISSLMISVTVCLLNNELSCNIRKKLSSLSGIPYENIMLCATHTHSGPNVAGAPGHGEMNTPYIDEIFIPQLINAVNEALENPISVNVGMAQGDSYTGVNRRQLTDKNTVILGQNPQGCMNPKMTVVAFVSEENKPIANMIHYGCHATGAGSNLEITRDWPGVMADTLERISGAVTAFFNGPAGDVGPRLTNGRTTGVKDIRFALEHGGYAANDAVSIYKKIKSYSNTSLKVYNGTIKIPLKERISLEQAKYGLEHTEEVTGGWAIAKYKDYCQRVIDSYKNGYTEVDATYQEQVIIALGDIAFVSFAFELFSQIGIRIDEYSEVPYVLSVAYTNGCNSYLVTQDQLCLKGYEVMSHLSQNIQPYADDVDFAIITSTVENLKNVK